MHQTDQTIKNLSKLISENWDEQGEVRVRFKYEKKSGPKLVREYRSRSDDRSIEATIESSDVELGLEWLKKIHREVKEICRRVKTSGGPELGYSVKLFQSTD